MCCVSLLLLLIYLIQKIIMKVNEVLACSFPSWYPLFRKITIKSKIHALPQEFVDYLLADNLILTNTCQPSGNYNFNLTVLFLLLY